MPGAAGFFVLSQEAKTAFLSMRTGREPREAELTGRMRPPSIPFAAVAPDPLAGLGGEDELPESVDENEDQRFRRWRATSEYARTQ
jgi:hypothetical protein